MGSLACSAMVKDRFDPGRSCDRWAERIVNGKALCWQHAQIESSPRGHWEEEARNVAQIRAMEPEASRAWWLDLIQRVTGRWVPGCVGCGHRATTSKLVVDPLTLARRYVVTCGRLRCVRALLRWEGAGDLRRQRALADREHEFGVATVADLELGMPVQYPSLSRATLRAFLSSEYEVATVRNGASVGALNGSIKSLGFDREVYAEVRSGQPVLRRVAA